jgi:cytochrome b
MNHIHNTPSTPRRLVTDAPTRMFHVLFALSFIGAYLTADGERWRVLHVTLGYTMAGLFLFRLLYGWLGPRHASLSLLWRKVTVLPMWWQSLRATPSWGTVSGRPTQNLLMALAVFALLLLVVPLTLSGYGTFNDWGDVLGGDWLEEVHEWFGEVFLIVVLLHLALLAGLSLLRQKNLAMPMLSGTTEGPGPNLVKDNPRWVAALLLLSVVLYIAWEWQQAPTGLLPAQRSGVFEDSD